VGRDETSFHLTLFDVLVDARARLALLPASPVVRSDPLGFAYVVRYLIWLVPSASSKIIIDN
jgi:hypothetical protein